MKIHSNRQSGFQNIFIPGDSLPDNIDLPEKTPYLILTLASNTKDEYLIDTFPLFKVLGYRETKAATEILTFTSSRKVDLAINAIIASPDYNHSQNTELLENLRLFDLRPESW